MDHNVVVRDRMTEKYLLDELKPEIRDQFEAHYFDCAECAKDICAGYEFVAHSKIVLAEATETSPIYMNQAGTNQAGRRTDLEASGRTQTNPTGTSRGWLAWLRPAFAAPALALLLAVIGYQNFFMNPALHSSGKPQVLPWASVNVGTWGADRPPLIVSAGQGFLLFVRIPPDGNYARYTADLYDPAGKLEWSLSIPATPGQDQWPLQVPGKNRPAGTYRMLVRGVTAGGESRDLGTTSFQLQIQN